MNRSFVVRMSFTRKSKEKMLCVHFIVLVMLCLGAPRVTRCCGHWYELMVGMLLYKQPLVVSTDYDLLYTAEEVRQRFPVGPSGHHDGALDEILLATLHNDIMEIIKVSRFVVLYLSLVRMASPSKGC